MAKAPDNLSEVPNVLRGQCRIGLWQEIGSGGGHANSRQGGAGSSRSTTQRICHMGPTVGGLWTGPAFWQSRPLNSKAWAKEVSKSRRKAFLGRLGNEDASEARSHGGPGAGSFLQPDSQGGAPSSPTSTSPLAFAISRCSLSVREVRVANAGGLTARFATPPLTAKGGMRRNVPFVEGGSCGPTASGTSAQ